MNKLEHFLKSNRDASIRTADAQPSLVAELQALTESGRKEQLRARIERLELDVVGAVEECRESARDGLRTAMFPVRSDSYGIRLGYSTQSDADYIVTALSNRGLKCEVKSYAGEGSANGFFVKVSW